MVNKMYIKLILLALIGYLGLVSYENYEREKNAQALLHKCKTLKLGMTRTGVIEIMGKPLRTITPDSGNEILVFLSGRVASTITQCVLGGESEVVEEIICGENHWLRMPKNDSPTVLN